VAGFLRSRIQVLSSADPSKAKRQLGWEAAIDMPQVVSKMMSEQFLGPSSFGVEFDLKNTM
jgi:GDP-D-mannose dehydratase